MARLQFRLASHWSETGMARLIGPMQEFINNSASGGIVLMAATIAALALANSPWAADYDALLHSYIGFTAGDFVLRETVQHWINDGLMAIFFFLVGLEIKREIRVGELSTLRAALFPIAAAFGGAVIPAALYMTLNMSGVGAGGWGVPMATDIAFALGILALLGSRVPFALKVFLTALAIVDDLMAVLVIALFYSGGVDFGALGTGLAILVLLFIANMLGIRSTVFYVLLGVIVWLAFLQSGVHATVAGVLVAWTIPGRNRIDPPAFLARVRHALERFERGSMEPNIMLTDQEQQSAVIELEEVCNDVQAPLQALEHSLHKWVAFGIVPIFALANAGVPLTPEGFAGEGQPVLFGIILGLVLGKPIGIVLSTWILVRTGFAALPPGVSWRHVVGVGFLGGIGFTMSLFIANLAFGEGNLLESSKLGILVASLIAGIIGVVILLSTSAVAEIPEAEGQPSTGRAGMAGAE